ncbi:c-type cytochrome [Magnetovirga frankeli]|uniref:ethylbenzene dehydrogenase-related protein n=1 Tax=Magnetovirga frankeli TaxID=947516 RepID=UPI001AFB0AC9|nr:c-type cytochrome [gamma proteobacterium SS-5]
MFHSKQQKSASLLGPILGALLLCGAAQAGRAETGLGVVPALQELERQGRLIQAKASAPLPSASAAIDWDQIAPQRLRLLAQDSVAPGLEGGAAVDIQLRALASETELALRIDWPDAQEDPYSQSHTDRFADALAVQFVTDPDPDLPYIGMGQPQRPVALWYWQAGRGTQALTAQGFGSLEPNPAMAAPEALAEYRAGGWSLVLRGALPATLNPLPLALARWDGAGQGRDGRKQLSAWHLLVLPGRALAETRLQGLVEQGRSAGDASRGARLAREQGCVACHSLPGQTPSRIGPNLAQAGGLHWPGYLRQAIERPSAFIVPGAGHAIMDPQGGARSLMPQLPLSPEQRDDLVAYLRQLVE